MSLRKPTVHDVRLALWFFWLAVFFLYVAGFILIAGAPGIPLAAAREAAWTAAYMFLPVLVAFAGFWFEPAAAQKGKRRCLKKGWIAVVASGTLVGHAIPLLYFGTYFMRAVVFQNLPDATTYEESFEATVAFGFKLLLLVGGLPTSLVNYLINREDVTLAAPPSK
jgi:hypothetical protein